MRVQSGSGTRNWPRLVMMLLIFGSTWGASEVVLGGALRAAHFRYASALLTGVGMSIMAMAVAYSGSVLVSAAAGPVAALATLLAVPLLHLPVACKANSCIALVLESGAMGLAALLLGKKMRISVPARMTAGAVAAIAASACFYSAGIHAAPCPYLYSFGGTPSFVLREGLVWAASAAILVPLGYSAGLRVSRAAVPLPRPGSPAFYGSAAAVAALCWGASAAAILSGL